MKKIGTVTVQNGCTSTNYESLKGVETGTYDLYANLPAAAQQAEATISAPCGCVPDAGIVCDTCAAMAEKNVNELAEYVNDFIEKRFPNGLAGEVRQIITECVLDAFHDGARWAEAQPPAASMIITDINAVTQKSKILIASR